MTAAKKLAREYELVYILKPAVTPAEAKKVADRVSDVIDKAGAKLTRVDNWGKRRLAYTIKTSTGRHTRGVFMYVRFVAFDNVVAELERNLRILDDVVRFQTIRLEALYDLEALEVDPEEVAFRELEAGAEEEDEDPSFEETLGMRTRERRREESSDDSSDDSSSDDDSSDSSDDDSSSDDDEKPAKAAAKPAAKPAATADSSEEEE